MDRLKLTVSSEIQKEVEQVFRTGALSQDEVDRISSLKSSINLNETGSITAYGAGVQKKIARISDSMLNMSKESGDSETSLILSDLVSSLEDFSTEAKKVNKGFFGLFKSEESKTEKLKIQYDTIKININRLSGLLHQQKVRLLKNIAMYDILYDSILEYFRELDIYIMAGEEKFKEINDVLLPSIEKSIKETGDQSLTLKKNSMLTAAENFNRKLQNLKITRLMSLQMGTQIKLLQDSDSKLISKIQDSILTTIPLWKNQAALSLGLATAEEALRTQSMITDTANKSAREHSAKIKAQARSLNKNKADSETKLLKLVETSEKLSNTVKEALRIQEDAKERRSIMEEELKKPII